MCSTKAGRTYKVMVLDMSLVQSEFDKMVTICKVIPSRAEACENMMRAVLKSGMIDGPENEAEEALVLNQVKYLNVVNTQGLLWAVKYRAMDCEGGCRP